MYDYRVIQDLPQFAVFSFFLCCGWLGNLQNNGLLHGFKNPSLKYHGTAISGGMCIQFNMIATFTNDDPIQKTSCAIRNIKPPNAQKRHISSFSGIRLPWLVVDSGMAQQEDVWMERASRCVPPLWFAWFATADWYLLQPSVSVPDMRVGLGTGD